MIFSVFQCFLLLILARRRRKFLEIEICFGEILPTFTFRGFQGHLAIVRVFGQILAIFRVNFGKIRKFRVFKCFRVRQPPC